MVSLRRKEVVSLNGISTNNAKGKIDKLPLPDASKAITGAVADEVLDVGKELLDRNFKIEDEK